MTLDRPIRSDISLPRPLRLSLISVWPDSSIPRSGQFIAAVGPHPHPLGRERHEADGQEERWEEERVDQETDARRLDRHGRAGRLRGGRRTGRGADGRRQERTRIARRRHRGPRAQGRLAGIPRLAGDLELSGFGRSAGRRPRPRAGPGPAAVRHHPGPARLGADLVREGDRHQRRGAERKHPHAQFARRLRRLQRGTGARRRSSPAPASPTASPAPAPSRSTCASKPIRSK